MAKRINWISYTMQNIPGNTLSDVDYHQTLSEARDAYVDYCCAVGTDECSMSLYWCGGDEEMISTARQFEDIGCPFDYPSKIVERGPRGGIKLINA